MQYVLVHSWAHVQPSVNLKKVSILKKTPTAHFDIKQHKNGGFCYYIHFVSVNILGHKVFGQKSTIL